MLDRRTAVLGLAMLPAAPALAQAPRTPSTLSGAQLAELMEGPPPPLTERVRGRAEAPVTVVEYASTTCGHCAHFHTNVLPGVMERYVNPGRVRIVFRPFTLNPLDAGAVMLSHCSGERYFPLIDSFFATQRTWATSNDPVSAMFAVARQAGFTQESFERCLRDQALLDAVQAVRDRASQRFGVNSTPTFFINGQMRVGAPRDLAEFESWLPAAARS